MGTLTKTRNTQTFNPFLTNFVDIRVGGKKERKKKRLSAKTESKERRPSHHSVLAFLGVVGPCC